MAVKIQLRRDLATNWSGSTVLASGEVGYETDTGNIKIGNGSTQWSALPYYQLPNVSVNPATMANLNDSAYRVMGRYRLNSVTGGSTFTNAPSDLDTADADSYCAMIVTSHAYTALSTLIQQTLTQFSGNGTTLKQWVRMYDGTNYTAWTSTAHLTDGEVTTAKIADDAVTAAKLADDASTDGNRAVTTNHIRDSAVTTAKIADDAVTFAKIQNSASGGLSVVGRNTNSAGAFAEIAAATDGHVLRRASSTSLGFGTIDNSSIAASAGIALSKLASQSATTFVGNSTASSAVPTAVSASTARTMLGLGSLALLSDIVEETSSSVNNGTTNFDGSSLTVGRLTLITISWSQSPSTSCTWNIVSESGEAFLVLFAGMTNEDGVGSLSTGPYDSVGTDNAGRQQFIFGALTRKVAFRQGFASGFTGTVYAVVIRLK